MHDQKRLVTAFPILLKPVVYTETWKFIEVREYIYSGIYSFLMKSSCLIETEYFTSRCVSGVVIQEDRSDAVCTSKCWDAPAGI